MDRGRPRFPPDFTCPAVLTLHPRVPTLSPTGLSPAPAARSSGARLAWGLVTRSRFLPDRQGSRTTPRPHRAAAHSADAVWARRVSLAATPRILSLPQGTEMFQFPHLPPTGLCVQPGVMRYHPHRVAPFGLPRINAGPRLPEAFRRVATSFIGRRRQGIHRAPSARFLHRSFIPWWIASLVSTPPDPRRDRQASSGDTFASSRMLDC